MGKELLKMEENNITGAAEDTIPQQEPSAEQETETAAAAGTPQPEEGQAAGDSSENTQAGEQETQPEDGFHVTYNHETQLLSRDDAVRYAQIGMKFKDSGIDIDTVKPIYNKLDYIAAQRGCSMQELVDGLLSSAEESHRKELTDTLGADNPVVEELMKVYRNEQKEKYERVLSDRRAAEESAQKEKQISLERRLAEEFTELKAEFPEIAEFSALPREVKAEAAKGRDLLSAYLRYTHKENKRTAAAEQAEKAAAKASTGQAASPAQSEENAVSAFMQGLSGI